MVVVRKFGAPNRDRTRDPLITNYLLQCNMPFHSGTFLKKIMLFYWLLCSVVYHTVTWYPTFFGTHMEPQHAEAVNRPIDRHVHQVA